MHDAASDAAAAAATAAAATAAAATAAAKPGADGKPAAGDPAAGKAAGEGGAGDQKPGDQSGQKPAEGSDGKPGEKTGGKDGAPGAQPKAPEKYELKVPDDDAKLLTSAALKNVEALARQANLSQADAQLFLDEQVALAKRTAEGFLTEAKSHPLYGGDKFTETQRYAEKLIDRIRPDGHPMRASFLAFVNAGGAINNVDVLSFLADVGRQMSEDSPGATRSITAGTKDVGSKFYDHPTSVAADQGSR